MTEESRVEYFISELAQDGRKLASDVGGLTGSRVAPVAVAGDLPGFYDHGTTSLQMPYMAGAPCPHH
jgi:hypothetical protein